MLQASMYLNKLPEKFSSEDKILVCDTMVATGMPHSHLPDCPLCASRSLCGRARRVGRNPPGMTFLDA